MRWAAVLDAGKVVAALAGMEAERPSKQVRNFPVLLRECPKWKRELAENGVKDLAAVMEPGIAALLAINARGADPRHAARALWREFSTARAAIIALLPPSGDMGPRRSA
ncbi:hypothetical protein E5222_15230 [Alteraurantiacibacter aquimixticola]|uniref:Uncharacterized protein n=1 Tax=Alteraurantiacibacter aquimixticola TaxID=2489173 RepID=A0A4T3F0A7_9SPHN|nr:hypothetical protein E5222_15230 [Alteraurantiacibacter aquimixticola]